MKRLILIWMLLSSVIATSPGNKETVIDQPEEIEVKLDNLAVSLDSIKTILDESN